MAAEAAPGGKSSEFKAALAALLLPIINGVMKKYLGVEISEETLMLAMGIAGMYIGGRTWHKTALAKINSAAAVVNKVDWAKVGELAKAVQAETDPAKKATMSADLANMVGSNG